ncbi:Uu.00g019560.m01.CDS01 [Anthostomella pinea]|uniref:Uu.00g019560.m01.CDS01 n=1 Tax=Anthostomella pinea TaxID=933095 RepID=A0AAI8VZC0_9PEZI|nr:Uu.00g019560.m01.CDS01 [Anthostomella pinea]
MHSALDTDTLHINYHSSPLPSHILASVANQDPDVGDRARYTIKSIDWSHVTGPEEVRPLVRSLCEGGLRVATTLLNKSAKELIDEKVRGVRELIEDRTEGKLPNEETRNHKVYLNIQSENIPPQETPRELTLLLSKPYLDVVPWDQNFGCKELEVEKRAGLLVSNYHEAPGSLPRHRVEELKRLCEFWLGVSFLYAAVPAIIYQRLGLCIDDFDRLEKNEHIAIFNFGTSIGENIFGGRLEFCNYLTLPIYLTYVKLLQELNAYRQPDEWIKALVFHEELKAPNFEDGILWTELKANRNLGFLSIPTVPGVQDLSKPPPHSAGKTLVF